MPPKKPAVIVPPVADPEPETTAAVEDPPAPTSGTCGVCGHAGMGVCEVCGHPI